MHYPASTEVGLAHPGFISRAYSLRGGAVFLSSSARSTAAGTVTPKSPRTVSNFSTSVRRMPGGTCISVGARVNLTNQLPPFPCRKAHPTAFHTRRKSVFQGPGGMHCTIPAPNPTQDPPADCLQYEEQTAISNAPTNPRTAAPKKTPLGRTQIGPRPPSELGPPQIPSGNSTPTVVVGFFDAAHLADR